MLLSAVARTESKPEGTALCQSESFSIVTLHGLLLIESDRTLASKVYFTSSFNSSTPAKLIFLSPQTDVKTRLSQLKSGRSINLRLWLVSEVFSPQLILNPHAATAHHAKPQRHARNNALDLDLACFTDSKSGAL